MTNSDWAQHIAQGEQKRRDTDYDTLHEQLQDEAKHLKADYLKELIYQAKVLRARQSGSTPQDERPEPATGAIGPGAGTDRQGEKFRGIPFVGKKPSWGPGSNPMPLGGKL